MLFKKNRTRLTRGILSRPFCISFRLDLQKRYRSRGNTHMSYSLLGETSTGTIAKGYGQRYSKLADGLQEDRLAGFDLIGDKSGALDSRRYPIRPRQLRITPTRFNPARRDIIRRNLATAERLAREMESSARVSDLMELSNAGFALTAALDELWDLRDEREDDWGDLLNILQGALAKEEFGKFSIQRCAAIRMIIADHLDAGCVDMDDIERSLRLLREAGLDPWKGISGMMASDATLPARSEKCSRPRDGSGRDHGVGIGKSD